MLMEMTAKEKQIKRNKFYNATIFFEEMEMTSEELRIKIQADCDSELLDDVDSEKARLRKEYILECQNSDCKYERKRAEAWIVY